MNRLNRREFLSVVAGASAISMAIPALASTSTADKVAADVTSLYVKGLVMVDLGNPEVIRLGFPKAPGHKATLSIVPEAGAPKVLTIKGKGEVEAPGVASADPKIFAPELIRMKEFYGNDVKSHIDQCPGLISIPRNAIRSITTAEVTPMRYTFVRSDNGEEVTSFRPRQVADALKIDLSSAGTLKMEDSKLNIPLQTTRELRVEYTAEKVNSTDPFADHFHHYFPYVERPAALDFDVVPRRVGATSAPAPTPHVGHHFMMLDAYVLCSIVAVP
ncbi:MAG TPA: hypothetical protein VKY31_13340 [Terriglobia bacterium]|nr:hypothetical protein [Terriglobia bacterium]